MLSHHHRDRSPSPRIMVDCHTGCGIVKKSVNQSFPYILRTETYFTQIFADLKSMKSNHFVVQCFAKICERCFFPVVKGRVNLFESIHGERYTTQSQSKYSGQDSNHGIPTKVHKIWPWRTLIYQLLKRKI